MTFLEIVKRLRNEARISGTGPFSVINQQGQLQELVYWVQSAYEDLQTQHANWKFLFQETYFTTIPGTQQYTKNSISAPYLSMWREGSFKWRIGASEAFLEMCNWDSFKTAYLMGASRSVTSQIPTAVSIHPDNSVWLWPIPSTSIEIHCEYFRQPFKLINDVDEPIFEDQFHMILVWMALKNYANQYGVPELYISAENNRQRILHNLERRYKDRVIYSQATPYA